MPHVRIRAVVDEAAEADIEGDPQRKLNEALDVLFAYPMTIGSDDRMCFVADDTAEFRKDVEGIVGLIPGLTMADVTIEVDE